MRLSSSVYPRSWNKRRAVTDKPAMGVLSQTAARLYKYPFEEQILIYAQRPGATACASIELWNRHMRRWVNRGARGIALLDNSAGTTTLRHVFDVSDTHSLDHVSFRLWNMKKVHQEQVAEELSPQFGDADETAIGFENQLLDIIRNAVQENMADYLTELIGARDGSYLAELDELNVGVIFRDALTDSYPLWCSAGWDWIQKRSPRTYSRIFSTSILSIRSCSSAARPAT